MTKDEELKAQEDAAEARPPDMQEMLDGPAFYANRMYASNVPLGMRLTFLEAAEGGPDHFRTAIFLTVPDVLALRDLLNQQLAKLGIVEMPTEAPADDGKGQ